ncbi:MAG: CHRD domain-containing protein [Pseudomonadota bacterium]
MALSRRIVLAATALSAALLAAGCNTTVMSNTAMFEAKLTAADEVPAKNSAGSGYARVWLNKDTRGLKWKIDYTGLTGPATMAHFHGPAVPGQNAPPILTFKAPVTSPIEGEVTLQPEHMADLMAGKWYVNIHTAANPGGEIRGQVVFVK